MIAYYNHHRLTIWVNTEFWNSVNS